MRKFVLAVMVLLILSIISVSAQQCKDLDEQPDLEDTFDTAAKTEYGIEDRTDTCISGKDGYSLPSGRWLREYYCDDEDKRAHKEVDCVGQGFEKCEGGKCVSSSKTTTSAPKPTSPSEACGNKKIDKNLGEHCDPPDSICYEGGEIGICTRPNAAGLGGCQCKLYESDDTAVPDEEEPEENMTTAPPVETPVENKTVEPKEEPSAAPEEDVRAPLPGDYEESKGVSVTRTITNNVKKFFSWIGSWFD